MANQYKADPRQALFLKGYLDPKSKTFSNALQSALAAGYEREYAEVIVSRDLDWVSEAVSKFNEDRLVEKAKRNVDALLDDEDSRIKADMTKFMLKNKGGYSEKQELEHTGEVVVRLGDDA